MKILNLIKNITIFLILMRAQNVQSQIKYPDINKYGYGIEVFSPANGHGTFYSLKADIYKGNNLFSFGPTIQKRSMIMNGFKVLYARNLSKGLMNKVNEGDELDADSAVAECREMEITKPERIDRIQFNFFTSFQYNKKLPLSYCLVRDEDLMQHGEPSVDFSALKFSTLSLSSGFSIQMNITRCINWKSYAGVLVYYHIDYFQGMDHPRIAPVLNLGTALSMVLDHDHKPHTIYRGMRD